MSLGACSEYQELLLEQAGWMCAFTDRLPLHLFNRKAWTELPGRHPLLGPQSSKFRRGTYREVPCWPQIVETELFVAGKEGVSGELQNRVCRGT
ncbi:hypothetical protein NDU88_001432 [Pleurodeles waltl]|uniref:Uncharacterized protein n=1 Tax=Pleurodeles waltl TaxID=8319 RepID=A0AAV7T088_PLEWA|nr:hypothetical protein NDU88_001432 [Pleurodeles waltl]